MKLNIHVGQATADLGNVAVAIAKRDVAREDLAKHAPIITLSPKEARDVAALLLTAADAAQAHRKLEGQQRLGPLGIVPDPEGTGS